MILRILLLVLLLDIELLPEKEHRIIWIVNVIIIVGIGVVS